MPYAFFLMVVTVVILTKPLNNLDEIWNYNFARTICEGRRPYIDINIIQTPLSAYIAALFLKLIGNNLYSFRILSIMLSFFILAEFFVLSNKMLRNKTIAFCATTFIMLIQLSNFSYDYNYLNLELILLLMLLETKDDKENSIGNDIVVGLLIGITPLVKQSTGACIVLAELVLCWIDWKIYGKSKKKICIKIICSLLPGILFLIVLLFNGTFAAFWDYAVRGIQYFDNHISYWEFMKTNLLYFILGILPFFFIGTSIYRIRNEKKEIKRRKTIAYILLAVAGFSETFPITDEVHFLIALTPCIICFFSSAKEVHMERAQSVFCNVFVVCVAGFVVITLIPQGNIKMCKLNHYENIPIYEEIEEQIIELDEYIEQKQKEGYEVLIADASAAVYMIPMDIYHKDFDLLLKGNTGSKTVRNLLNVKTKALFLILKEEKQWNWQTNRKFNYYVMENYRYIEEVNGFGVYSAKE